MSLLPSAKANFNHFGTFEDYRVDFHRRYEYEMLDKKPSIRSRLNNEAKRYVEDVIDSLDDLTQRLHEKYYIASDKTKEIYDITKEEEYIERQRECLIYKILQDMTFDIYGQYFKGRIDRDGDLIMSSQAQVLNEQLDEELAALFLSTV